MSWLLAGVAVVVFVMAAVAVQVVSSKRILI
jgi:hypothetical protein